MLTTQSNIPISVKQPDGTKRYVSTDDDPAFDISNFSMVDIMILQTVFKAAGNMPDIFYNRNYIRKISQ